MMTKTWISAIYKINICMIAEFIHNINKKWVEHSHITKLIHNITNDI